MRSPQIRPVFHCTNQASFGSRPSSVWINTRPLAEASWESWGGRLPSCIDIISARQAITAACRKAAPCCAATSRWLSDRRHGRIHGHGTTRGLKARQHGEYTQHGGYHCKRQRVERTHAIEQAFQQARQEQRTGDTQSEACRREQRGPDALPVSAACASWRKLWAPVPPLSSGFHLSLAQIRRSSAA